MFESGVQAVTPKSYLMKEVEVDTRKFLAGLAAFSKATTKLIITEGMDVLSWADAAQSLARTSSSFSLADDTVKEKAWKLMFATVTRATADLMRDSRAALAEAGFPGRQKQPVELDEKDIQRWMKESFSIDTIFFDNPEHHPFVKAVKEMLELWLVTKMGIPSRLAETIAGRLPRCTRHAVTAVWKEDPNAFADVKFAVQHPWIEGEKADRDWYRYAAYMEYQVTEPMLDQPFGLENVYVRPRAEYHERQRTQRGEESQETGGRRRVVDLWTDVLGWVKQWPTQSRLGTHPVQLYIIQGDPGVGKSAFSRMLAHALLHEKAEDGQPVPDPVRPILIPLHRLTPGLQLSEQLAKRFREMGFQHDPLHRDTGDDRLLLIFDGLDELSKAGETARTEDFIRELSLMTSESEHRRIKAILTGRIPAIQAQQNAYLKKYPPVREILPYWDPKWKTDDEELLRHDQRDDWWTNYETWTGLAISEKDRALLLGRKLTDLTRYPLLLQLVTTAVCRPNSQLPEDPNRNLIYELMLQRVFARDYAVTPEDKDEAEVKGGDAEQHPHPAVQTLSYAQYRLLLQQVGLLSWYNNGREVGAEAVRHACSGEPDLQQAYASVQESAGGSSTNLFLAFFFRQGEDTPNAYEFTHKSFGEYLTATKIIDITQKFVTGYASRSDTPDDILRKSVDPLGQAGVETNLRQFIDDEVAWRVECNQEPPPFANWPEGSYHPAVIPDPATWRTMLADVIARISQQGFPAFPLAPPMSARMAGTPYDTRFLDMQRQAARVLLNLLELHGAVALLVRPQTASEKGEVIWGEAVIILWSRAYDQLVTANVKKKWWERSRTPQLAWLLHQLAGISELDTFVRLTHVNISSCALDHVPLARADLTRADLTRANLTEADLRGANLTEANLFGANLTEADLTEADLTEADLTEADLTEADLRGANLRKADLTEADLRGANLRGANLRGANLVGAKGVTRDQLFSAGSVSGAYCLSSDLGRWGISKDDKEKLGLIIFDAKDE